MYVAVSSPGPGLVDAAVLDADGGELERVHLASDEFPAWAAEREREHPRWVWADTKRWYPLLLRAGVRVERCLDLRMCRLILRTAAAAAGTGLARAPRDRWDDPAHTVPAASDALFELAEPEPDGDPAEELRRQRAAIAESAAPGRLTLLTAADSVGALVAVELEHAGLPWDAERHDRILVELLGERVPGGRPARMEALVAEIRAALDDPDVNPDSASTLLKSLQRAGLRVGSTSKWELREHDHPVVQPLLAYKRLARLYTANGWAWLGEWVRGGRFRPVYVPAGVVTGRWASDGGGALQLPKQVRAAVVPDPGWKLVVADAAQLEPRVLAAMSGDAAMARAGRAHDLYQGLVETGAVETREQAKYGMLGAIYGGTTGESGRMRPRMERAFPRAMAFVESAARAGEAGEVVSTWLGRTSPPGRDAAYDETRSYDERARARSDGRAWGRFTRNFVVQGTAAEWALCWMGALRRMLWELGGGDADPRPLTERPHLVFFLHDELIVHAPAELADAAADALRAAAAEAGRILFGSAPVEFPVTVAVVDSYADAK
ncbi:MAG: bifunctional 3'-5' exonuclease/DNA polymerase [Microbacteriaceae bacterium]|nr:MAG: bifunctional 3'-5' exonuclease/DNA polymerase [Microbacteriaceae bacterium]